MQGTHRTADQLFHQGINQGLIECFNKALEIYKSLSEYQLVDCGRFEASIYAGLSAAYGRLGKHLESFASANKALVFYDQFGDNYPADTGRWLIAQVNQGTALAALGCLAQAIEALQLAKQIFTNKGLDAAQNDQWLEMVDGNITAIYTQMKKNK